MDSIIRRGARMGLTVGEVADIVADWSDEYETDCSECREAIRQGYTICGPCSVPVERWEVTTPPDVWA